jgi:HD superfamily phosphohydrolase
MAFIQQRVRDPVHNLIEFSANEFESTLWRVVQTAPFQRLRRIKQLGFSDLVYPGATHSRFAHSIGVFHTARQLMRVIERHLGASGYETTRANAALAASLVHDLGHGPFSHAFEDVGRRFGLKLADHEHVSDALIRRGEVAEALKALGSGFADDVADIIKSAGPGRIYSAVVSSQFDADRLDYMRRDRLMTGTGLGAIDFEWLIANVEIGSVASGVDEKSVGTLETFVLGPKAIHAAETYVLGLFQLYPTVYFHKATRSAEKIFTELLSRLIALIKDGSVNSTGLPENHPVVAFALDSENVERVLALDDTAIWGALPLLAGAKDGVVCELSCRLRDRKLFKCIDIREHLAGRLGAGQLEGELLEKACASIQEKAREWIAEHAKTAPRIFMDQAVREPYKRFQESKGPLNQIRIKTRKGELVDLGERSKIVAAIEPFRLFRMYIADGDGEAKKFIEDAITAEVDNVKKKA